MIDLLVVTMGDAWGAEILGHNIAHAGIPTAELDVKIFMNSDATCEGVMRIWYEAIGDVGSVRILSDGENHGFPVAANELLHASPNDEIILVDDDVRYQDGWLARLREARQAVIKSGRPAGLGGIPLEQWQPEELGRLTDIRGVKLRPRACPIGGCRHIGRDIIDEMGYICELYYPCGGGDVDFCSRLAWAGKYNYHIDAVRSKHEHHERDAAYKQAKAEALTRIADAYRAQQYQYRQGHYRFVPQRPWLFS